MAMDNLVCSPLLCGNEFSLMLVFNFSPSPKILLIIARFTPETFVALGKIFYLYSLFSFYILFSIIFVYYKTPIEKVLFCKISLIMYIVFLC